MRVPTIHLNGTGGQELFEQACEAMGAIRKALDACAAAAPNGRDYYVQDGDALREAQTEHEARIARLRSVLTEYETIAEAIADQRDARGEG